MTSNVSSRASYRKHVDERCRDGGACNAAATGKPARPAGHCFPLKSDLGASITCTPLALATRRGYSALFGYSGSSTAPGTLLAIAEARKFAASKGLLAFMRR